MGNKVTTHHLKRLDFGLNLITNQIVKNMVLLYFPLVFLHHTWFDRVWPVIKVEEEGDRDKKADDDKFTTMRTECLTAPEMDR